MADAQIGKTEVDSASMELVAGITQDFLIQGAKLSSTVTDVSAFAVPGADVIKFPKMAGFTVGDKVENTAVDAQLLTYAVDVLELDKHKVIQILVEKKAQIQGPQQMLADLAERAGKGMALQLDIDIIAALELASAAAPDHRLAYIGTGIAAADILAARTLLNKQNVPMTDRYLGVSPDSEAAMLAIPEFITADKYGSAGGLIEGELGRIYGFTVIMHNNFATARTIAWHKSAVAFGLQSGLDFQTESALAHLGTRYSFDQMYGVKTMDAGKRQVLLGTAT